MKSFFLACSLGLPLAAGAQNLVATLPPATYYVGSEKAPLFRRDTLGRPSLYAPPYAAVMVVGRFAPHWVVVKYESFLYLMPTQRLTDYAADAAALPIDPQTRLITYEGVVPVPGASQADLYARARAWVSREYPATTVTSTSPAPAGSQLELQGKRPAVVHVSYNGVARNTNAGVVRHTLSLYFKDGRYKYVLTNLTHDALGMKSLNSGGPLEQDNANLFGYAGLGSHDTWVDLKAAATRDARQLLADLQAALTLQAPAPVGKPAAQPRKDPRDF